LKRTLKRLLLSLSLGAFALSIYQVSQYWNYQEVLLDLNKELQLTINKDQIDGEIQTSIDKSDFDDARMYLQIAQSNNYAIDYKYYQRQLANKDTQINRIVINASNFTNGFLQGESSSMAGIAGAVSADFTVIGDVRDLRKEYAKHQQGKGVNELIVILSGAGIGLTALTVGSLGSAAPAKAGASLMKVAVKAQRLTRGFQKQLIRQGRKVFDWPVFTRLAKQDKSVKNIRRAVKEAYHPEAIEPLKVIATQVNSIRRSSSAADTLHLIKYVDNSDDLLHLEKITAKHGSQTKGYFKFLGKGALRGVRVLRKTAALLISIISSVLSGILSVILLFSGRKNSPS
jgi:CRISPR/Cas system-associated protein endoribonuclease Cas2